MNRHFVYSAMSAEPLGAPIRKEPPKQSPETPWKPVPGHPDYVERINAQGIREVSHKDHAPLPVVVAPAAGCVTPEDVHGEPAALADVSTEWHSGPPPAVGWFNAEAAPAGMFEKLARYFDGRRWSLPVALNSKLDWKKERMEEAAGGDIEWRGPRLTGNSWPVPDHA